MFGKWQGRFYSMFLETLLLVDRSAQSPMVKKPWIPQDESESIMFAIRAFGKPEELNLYYRWLVYVYLTMEWLISKKYEEQVMQGTVETFWRWANELLEKVTDKHMVYNKFWIISSPFYPMCYLYDAGYLPGTVCQIVNGSKTEARTILSSQQALSLSKFFRV